MFTNLIDQVRKLAELKNNRWLAFSLAVKDLDFDMLLKALEAKSADWESAEAGALVQAGAPLSISVGEVVSAIMAAPNPKLPSDTKGSFGEPISLSGCVLHDRDGSLCSMATMRRAVACVNALAGVEEPEKWAMESAIARVERDQLADELTALRAEVERLQAFKRLTHETLDSMGVPEQKDDKCRISSRLAFVRGLLSALRARVAAMEKVVEVASRYAFPGSELHIALDSLAKQEGRGA